MNTLKLLHYGKTKMIAHRGLSGIYLENTLSAFKAAGRRSYYGIESDVHVTKDNRFVVFHDDTTGRIAKKDLRVEDTECKKLRRLCLKFHRMPNLSEYITVCKKYSKVAVLELKNPMSRENIRRIVEIIEEIGYLKQTVFISFAAQNLKYIRELKPDQTVQFLCSEFTPQILELLISEKFDLDINYKALTKEIIDDCHSNGIKVNCWTVDDISVAERLVEYGIDYITTDIIE
ncbi:MAG: hypothetical protein IK086_03775 [Clostridia bacterium]|nr:hypothetical protein [Clostridia bacterium]